MYLGESRLGLLQMSRRKGEKVGYAVVSARPLRDAKTVQRIKHGILHTIYS